MKKLLNAIPLLIERSPLVLRIHAMIPIRFDKRSLSLVISLRTPQPIHFTPSTTLSRELVGLIFCGCASCAAFIPSLRINANLTALAR